MFNKSLLVATCLMVSMPAYAVPVVDGFLDANEYSNFFTVGWYNGHEEAGSQFKKADDHKTTVYWDSNSTSFFLYLEVPLEAKSMIWGTGVTEAEARLYYQHWCSPNDGNPAADDGSNCSHHVNGWTTFLSKIKEFGTMTGSEKVIFGQGVKGDLAKGASGNSYGSILDYMDSVDYVTSTASGLGCNTTNCGASNIPMAFEFEFGVSFQAQIIQDIENNELEFHLSPERGATSAVPVPSSIAILGLGLAVLGFSRKKKNT